MTRLAVNTWSEEAKRVRCKIAKLPRQTVLGVAGTSVCID